MFALGRRQQRFSGAATVTPDHAAPPMLPEYSPRERDDSITVDRAPILAPNCGEKESLRRTPIPI
jgi:hypothetical protein